MNEYNRDLLINCRAFLFYWRSCRYPSFPGFLFTSASGRQTRFIGFFPDDDGLGLICLKSFFPEFLANKSKDYLDSVICVYTY